MSHRTHERIAAPRHAARGVRSLRLGLALLLGLAVSLLVAPAALAKFSVSALRLGSSSGPTDYLYTAGNTVVEQGKVGRGSWYRFDVYDPSGATHFTVGCRSAANNGLVTGSYRLQSGDTLSNTTAWRFQLRRFASKANCTSATSAQNDASLYFDVAAATSYGDSGLTTEQGAFGAGGTAYVQVAGAGKVDSSPSNGALNQGTWSTSWILPSGATACANTVNNASDLPGSTTNGQLPDQTKPAAPSPPSLQYSPSSGPGLFPWNQIANYETKPCPAFASANQGQWSLRVSADSTHFVTLPVFTVNTTPPHTTLTSGPSNTSASQTATFTFTSSEPGSTFQCQLDGAAWTSCPSPKTYTALTNGGHTFAVRAIDPAGNVDPTPAGTAWIVDMNAPAVTLLAPAAGSYTNDATTQISGTADPAGGDSNVTVDIYSGTGVTGTLVQSPSATVQGDGTWKVNAATLPDGTYTVQAQQTDTLQRTGYSEQVTFTVDTTPPAVTVTAPANGTHTNDTTPEISGTAGTAPGDLSPVTITVTQGATTVESTSAAVSPSGTWDIDLPQALADGNYTLNASQPDLAGNTGFSSSDVLTIDTTAPQTFLDAAPTGVTSSTTARFSFHSTDALSPAGSTFQCQLDGGAWGGCTSPISYFNLANGSHSFSVEAIDGAGNLDTTGQTTTWTVNTALPAITLKTPTDGVFTNDTTPNFSGTAGTAAGDSSSIQVLIYSNTDLSGSPVQTLSTTATSGSWSVSGSALPDGTYVAYAQQSGVAGTANSVQHVFTVDTQASTTTIAVGPPGASGTGDASFSFTSSEPGSRFQCQLDSGGWISCTSPQDYFGLPDGSHTFQVRAIDRAGNTGNAATQTWSVNTNLPAVSLTAPGDGTVTNNPSPAITGTGGIAPGDASTVTIELYAGTSIAGGALQTLTTTVSSADGSWSSHPSTALTDGTYTVYAKQDGAAGTAFTSAHTFTINTAAPTTSITSGPQGTTAATTARFTFTSSEAGSTFECQLDNGAWTGCSSPQTYSGLTVGQHTFSVQATDPAGNVDPSPPVAAWTIDTPTNAPLTLTAPADGIITSNSTPTFSGTASAGNSSAISVEIDDANGNPVEILSAAPGGSWSVAASPSLPDGSYTAFASQLGSDGVTTDYSAVVGFTVDTTPPTTAITSGPRGTTAATTAQFAFVSSEAGSTFQCQLDGAGWAGCSSPKSYSGLSVGSHTFTVRATDQAGNVDPDPPTVNWTIDTPANSPLTLTAPADGAVTNGTPTFSGTASAADTNGISVEIDDNGGSAVEILSADAGSAWSVKASPSLPGGSYTAVASQLGSDGVTTDYSGAIGFTVDGTPPTVTLTSAPTGTSNNQTPSFSGTLGTAPGDVAGVTLVLYNGSGTTGTPVQTIPATVSGNSWSATAAAMPDGTYTARAEQSDTVGNTGYSVRRTFAIDTVPPTTPQSPGSPQPPSGSGPSGNPAPSGNPTPPANPTRLRLTLSAKARQHLSRRGIVTFKAKCSAACTLALSGKIVTVRPGKLARQTKPRTMNVSHLAVKRLAAGKTFTLTIRLSARTKRAIAAALAKKKHLVLTLTGVVSAHGAKPGTASVKIRLLA